MRVVSVSESAKLPRPEPSTRPMRGHSGVFDRTSLAPDSARTKASFIRNSFSLGVQSVFLLELGELFFQLPLLSRVFARGQKFVAGRRGPASSRCSACTSREWAERTLGRGPQTGAGQKAVLQTLASEALHVGVGKIVALDCAQIFVRHIGTRHTLVVG